MQHKAKKSLGQNFLKGEFALQKIIESGEIKSNDVILEIGPGKGALTKKLLEKSDNVIAIEKDRDLFDFLKTKFEKEIAEKKLTLINEDILEFIPRKNINYKIIANIPYNITGAILKKFLTEENQPELMVLMVQYEVGKRIVARDDKESILSVSIKAYGEPKLITKVPSRYFSPAPKVDSAIISIKNISRKLFENSNSTNTESKKLEEKFWEVVKIGFAHKRKKLSSNLKNLQKNIYSSLPKKLLEELGDKRAEDLSTQDWISLVNE